MIGVWGAEKGVLAHGSPHPLIDPMRKKSGGEGKKEREKEMKEKEKEGMVEESARQRGRDIL